MKFDRSNKFDLCYYGQVNSLRQKSSVASKWASKHLWGNIPFAGDGTYSVCDKENYRLHCNCCTSPNHLHYMHVKYRLFINLFWSVEASCHKSPQFYKGRHNLCFFVLRCEALREWEALNLMSWHKLVFESGVRFVYKLISAALARCK